ncbi:hypothetical protein [Kitasatospora sp. NPDC092286]|uniref:hypothetical protein n=1 Tax=Kitasatospora sp. NPDC092286 TaxID=3364087 RepID=UPI0038183385
MTTTDDVTRQARSITQATANNVIRHARALKQVHESAHHGTAAADNAWVALVRAHEVVKAWQALHDYAVKRGRDLDCKDLTEVAVLVLAARELRNHLGREILDGSLLPALSGDPIHRVRDDARLRAAREFRADIATILDLNPDTL